MPLQLDYAAALAALERSRIMSETKDRHADDVARDVELAGVEREKILADQVDLNMRMQVWMVLALFTLLHRVLAAHEHVCRAWLL